MKTYFEYYNTHYKKKLQAIDLFLKTSDWQNLSSESNEKVADLLDISIQEVAKLMDMFKIHSLNQTNFFILLKHGDSDICKLFRRQLHIGMKSKYTASDISYIYQIPYKVINTALSNSEIETITDENIQELFLYVALE